MNKQEFIERMKSLKNIFGNKNEYIEIDAVIELASELDKPQKPVVPQFVADWYEENKDDFETKLFNVIATMTFYCEDEDLSDFEEWISDKNEKPFQTLVNMHQFGYTVEKEKRYLVEMKNLKTGFNFLNYCKKEDRWIFSSEDETTTYRSLHTRKELEEADFGWVFDCPGIEIEEV